MCITEHMNNSPVFSLCQSESGGFRTAQRRPRTLGFRSRSMESNTQDRKLLYKVAKAYYEDNLTQQQIAGRFGISRVKVSRVLSRARDIGIVQISINPPESSNADLEREIEARYALKEAIVVTAADPNASAVVAELGLVGARYLVRRLQGHEVVAISWGSTLLSVVDALPSASFPDVRVVQMIGGLGELEAKVHGSELVRRMAQAFGARPRLLHAPGIVKNRSVRDALVSDSQVADTLELAAQAHIALVGLGELRKGSTLLEAGVLAAAQIQELRARGAVGDVALRFFDEKGVEVLSKTDAQIVGLDMAAIKKIPCVIGVAGGDSKIKVVRAVLTAGLIDVLITDDRVAVSLLECSRDKQA